MQHIEGSSAAMTEQEHAVQIDEKCEQAGMLMLRLQHLRVWRMARSLPVSHSELKADLSAEQDTLADALWRLLEPDLYAVARRWQGSHVPRSVVASEAVRSTGLISFSYVMQALDTTYVSLDNNPIGLARSIAWRALNSIHKRETRALNVLSRPRPGEQTREDQALPKHLPVPIREVAEVVADPDPNQDAVIALMARQEIWAAMCEFLEALPDKKDLEILTLSVEGLNSKEIAARMAGWSDAAVRKRLSRLRPKLGAELRRLGLLEEEI